MGVQQLTSVQGACDWLRAQGVRGLSADSRRLEEGDALLAWPGARHDPREQLAGLLAGRARAALVEQAGSAPALERLSPAQTERVASFDGLRLAAGPIAHAFYGQPSEAVELIAVTGTNGKTSVSWGIAQGMAAAGRRCAVAGTLGVGEPGRAVASTGLTTPDAVSLHRALHEQRQAGVGAMALEASSIGLAEGRLEGCRIRIACFTQLSQDHLDYHGSMQAYWSAKQRLFDWPGLQAAVVCVDHPHGVELARRLRAERPALSLWTVSAADATGSTRGHGDATIQLRSDGHDAQGRQRLFLVEGGRALPFSSALLGGFNRENLAVVAGALRASGLTADDTARALQAIEPVAGRLQPVPAVANAPQIVVDYAHTPDALSQVLAALAPLAEARGGRLWCVFGCGGNRDRSKRPLMAAAAEQGAHRVVITSDNPRDEDPEAILRDVQSGLSRAGSALVVEDRRAAIERAVTTADPQDLILIAGKGHEAEQEIAGVRHPFSDVAEATRALELRGRSRP